MLFLVLTTVMAITAISNSSQNMNEVAAGGVKPKRSNSRGVRIVGSRIYDSANGKTCHQVLFFFEILRIPVSFFLVFLRCGVCSCLLKFHSVTVRLRFCFNVVSFVRCFAHACI